MNDYKQSIDENYEDALFAKLMDEHAQIEGARLLEENERLKNDPDFHMPEDLDERCMKTIKKVSRAKKYNKIGSTAVTVLKHVAVFALICSVIFTGLWCTASAFRNAVFKLFSNDCEEKTDIQINESLEEPLNNKNSEQVLELPEGVSEPTWLPKGYFLSLFSCDDNQLTAKYINNSNSEIYYKELSGGFSFSIDTEDADEVESIIINGYEGFLVSKGEQLSVTWGNTDSDKLIRILSNSISKEEILRIAKSVTK